MGYQAYRNLGGVPAGTPGFNPAAVYEPIPSKTMPYLLMISVLGAFLLTQMRKLMICDWRLPFPSGTASGIMLTSFHTAVSSSDNTKNRFMLFYPQEMLPARPWNSPYAACPTRLGKQSAS